MSADANSYILLGQIAVAGVAVGGPIAGILVWVHKKFDKKADKHAVANYMQEVKGEQAVQRTHIGKLFDKLEEHSRRDEELAREIIETISTNHAEVLRTLGNKEDRP